MKLAPRLPFSSPIARFACAAAALALLGGCAVNPVTGQQQFALLSESEEIAIGNEGAKQVAQQYVRWPDEQLQAYANGVGQRLAAVSHRPALKYEYTVLDAPMVNAFALPGGHIYITRGIMAMMNSEDEFAGVLGHETGHVTARHSVAQISKQQALGALSVLGMIAGGPKAVDRYGRFAQIGLAAAMSGFSRKDELQADDLGAEYTARAGWNPDGARRMLGMLDRLYPAQPEAMERLFMSHPPPADRVKRALERQATLPPESLIRPILRDAYLARLDGLEYGPSLRAGLMRDGIYYNSNWGVKLTLPAGWQSSAENEDALLKAATPEGSQQPAALQLIGLRDQPSDDAAIAGLLQRIGAQSLGEQRVTVGGLPARRFDLSIAREGAAPLRMRAWFAPKGADLLLLLAYSTQAAALQTPGTAIEQLAAFGFTEAAKFPVEKLRVLRAEKAESPESIAKARLAGEGAAGLQALKLINGWSDAEAIAAGARYKLPPPSMIATLRKSMAAPPTPPAPVNG